MKRRTFTKLAGFGAVAISTTGFVNFNGTRFVGDCETTTDILGPFYRPNSPVRTNLVIEGEPGAIVELSGTIRHKDCKTVIKNAKIELWHCSANEIYDNDSDEFRYRGTTFSDEHGNYSFRTQMPVPYDAGGGLVRPAHFHMMVSSNEYQSLVTQIYFQGDPYVDKDPWSSALKAAYRRVEVLEEDGIKKVIFDCNMNTVLKPNYTAFDRIVGTYKNDQTGEPLECFEDDGVLWIKNEVYGNRFEYIGENRFEYAGLLEGSFQILKFALQPNGTTTLEIKGNGGGQEMTENYTKS